MKKHNLKLIRDSIAQAIELEQESNELHRYLGVLAPQLHKAISLPAKAPADALLEFVIRYIQQVPDFLEILNKLLQEAGIEEQGQVFVNIAEDFFSNPPELIKHEVGLKALIDKAYLAHRLLEEINDRLLMMCGAPLTPMDMTLSNIVIHDILGEEFANQLDMAVHYTIETLFNPENIAQHRAVNEFLAKLNAQTWGETLKDWPCMASDLSIELNFDSLIGA